LKNLLLERLYASGLKFAVNGPDLDAAAPHIINISFPGVRGEVLVHFLEGMNIFISTGAACSSRKVKLSHVLKAIGIDPKIAEGSVRISFSVSNDSEDVELLARGIETALTQMGVH
ncbi:MAG: aminotransferase class V-fold PLP-dependent enzyme, partial [Chitinophagales bacterium]